MIFVWYGQMMHLPGSLQMFSGGSMQHWSPWCILWVVRKVSYIPEHCEIPFPRHPVLLTFLGQHTLCGVVNMSLWQKDSPNEVTGQLSDSGWGTPLSCSRMQKRNALKEKTLLAERSAKRGGWLLPFLPQGAKKQRVVGPIVGYHL